MTLSLPFKTILITGAGGILGTELLKQLSQYTDTNVIALTSKPEDIKNKFYRMKNLVCFSLTDFEKRLVPFDAVDIVIHCAFARSQDGIALGESLLFSKEIFQESNFHNVKGVINISSQSVYGKKEEIPWTEKSQIIIESFYALAKYSSELQTMIFNDNQFGITRFTNLRLASLVGPGLDNRLVSKFVQNALNDQPLKVMGGNQVMAYMDVRDAASGIISFLTVKPSLWNDVYNLGNHWYHSVLEIAEMVKLIASEYSNSEVEIRLLQDSDELRTGMDCRSFYEQTGWQPRYDLEMIIRNLFDWYTNRETN